MIQRIVGVLAAAYSCGVKALFTDLKPGARNGRRATFLDGQATGIRGKSKASLADSRGQKFRLSVVVECGQFVTCASLPLNATTD